MKPNYFLKRSVCVDGNDGKGLKSCESVKMDTAARNYFGSEDDIQLEG